MNAVPMATVISVPKEYGYVITAAAATFFLGAWHGIRVGGYRKAAGLGYPQSAATPAEIAAASGDKKKALYLFNCARRAEENFHENHASAVIAMLIAGIQYPLTTTGLAVAWAACRVLYATGYTDPSKDRGQGRMRGGGFWLAQLGLVGLAGWTGVRMVL